MSRHATGVRATDAAVLPQPMPTVGAAAELPLFTAEAGVEKQETEWRRQVLE